MAAVYGTPEVKGYINIKLLWKKNLKGRLEDGMR
jgi:hypothetical protein